jgi:pentatricopeptide repeat protein
LYEILVRQSLHNRNVALAHSAFDEMMPKGVFPNTATFDLRLRACAMEGNVEKAMLTMEFMKQYGISRSVKSYNNMIFACSKRYSYYLDAFGYFKEMVAQGIAPNIGTFHALLQACAFCSDLANAQLLFNQLPMHGLTADESTYAQYLNVIAATQKRVKIRVGKLMLSQKNRADVSSLISPAAHTPLPAADPSSLSVRCLSVGGRDSV